MSTIAIIQLASSAKLCHQLLLIKLTQPASIRPHGASALYGVNDLGTTVVCSPVKLSQPNTAGSIQPSGARTPTGCTRLVDLQERPHRLHQVGGVNQVFILAAPDWWGRSSGGTSYTR